MSRISELKFTLSLTALEYHEFAVEFAFLSNVHTLWDLENHLIMPVADHR